jgi:uncharacterized protein YciI
MSDETETEPAWYVLEHRPGPALSAGDSVFAHPKFSEHVAFLGRLHARGLLVAAGPLPDEAGAGMTIVRTPGTPSAQEVERLAREDDQCVAAGVLSVRVRPWSVMFTSTD